jgi:hypothetical protein
MSSTGSSDRTSPENEQRYSRLQELTKHVAVAQRSGLNPVESCSKYLNLRLPAGLCQEGCSRLDTFNRCFRSLQVSNEGRRQGFPSPIEIPKTRWQDTKPAEFSRQLFHVLNTKFSECLGDQNRQHQAMLQLDSTRLDGARLDGTWLKAHSLAFEVFFLPCGARNYWQASRFMPMPKWVHCQLPPTSTVAFLADKF